MTPSKRTLRRRYGPPDDLAEVGDVTNSDRAAWALTALEAFCGQTNQEVDDWEASIGDLIGDLMHLAVTVDADPEVLLERGRHHFIAEVGLGYDD